MSKVKTLKKQHDFLNLTLMDVIQMIDPSGKSKYVDLFVASIKQRFLGLRDIDSYLDEFIEVGCPQTIKNQDRFTKVLFHELLRLFEPSDLSNVYKFHELNERQLIANNDISTYSTLSDLSKAISLAELRLNDKELEKQIIVLNDDRDWLVIKPLSHESSVKYGYGTKWCTAMKDERDHFFRYIHRGILIYCINTKTGDKVAFFHNINSDYDKETSFWNAKDDRIDSMESDLPSFVLDIIKEQIANKVTNADLRSEELVEAEERLIMSKYTLLENEIAEPRPNPVQEARAHLQQAISEWANRTPTPTDIDENDVIAEI